MIGFRDGDVVQGEFRAGWRVAWVVFADRHSDALCFVDECGRDLGAPTGEIESVGAYRNASRS